jgi:Predicted phosphotransacetylase
MNNFESLTLLLNALAQRKNRRIGIGVQAPTDALIEGFRQAQIFCTPVLYGAPLAEFDSVASSAPEERMISDLEKGDIDAAVRGQVHAEPFRAQLCRLYGQSFQPSEQMIVVLEFPGGRPMIMSPASNTIAGHMGERAGLIESSVSFCKQMGLPVKIGLLARCRPGEVPDESSVALTDRQDIRSIIDSHRETEMLVEQYRDRFAIKNYGIDFEKAYEDGVTILIEPNGTVGNQVIRTLYFLGAVKFYGAPLMNAKHVVLESFRNSRELADVMLLAAAMANVRTDP